MGEQLFGKHWVVGRPNCILLSVSFCVIVAFFSVRQSGAQNRSGKVSKQIRIWKVLNSDGITIVPIKPSHNIWLLLAFSLNIKNVGLNALALVE